MFVKKIALAVAWRGNCNRDQDLLEFHMGSENNLDLNWGAIKGICETVYCTFNKMIWVVWGLF